MLVKKLKQKYNQPSKKIKRPNLPQKQVLGIGKTIGLYCAAVPNLEFVGVVIPYDSLDFDNFPFSHFLISPKPPSWN